MKIEMVPLSNHNQANEETSHHVIVTVTEVGTNWLSSAEAKIKKVPRLLNKSAGKESCCIFRVPQSLVEVNKKAYQPHIVSIGPYHHGKKHLKMIQEHKWRFLGALLVRTQRHGVGLKDLFESIASMEEEIRECYSESIDKYTSQQLIEMMVLDGCFIIELFCIVCRLVPRADLDLQDPLFNVPWVLAFLMRDLLRLENQIPFFVLQNLFGQSILLGSGSDNVRSLVELTLEFFNYTVDRPVKVLESYNNLQGKHLLDLFRLSLLPLTQKTTRNDSSPVLDLIQSAKKLHLAGIQFKPRKTDSFFDINFNNGVLEIPRLTIDDFTTSVILNCVAFEQCYGHCLKHVTSYAVFMGCLINTASDAGFLCDHKIIENYFGTDKEVARFFHGVGKDVAFDIETSYLSKLFEDVNEYYSNGWHVQWAGFIHTYFDTPWSFMSALAALLLLILTMIQAFFAIYAYVRPPK